MRKIVNFELCKTCKHYDISEAEEPCASCLNQGDNEDNSAPVFYEKDEKRTKNLSQNGN